jgi:hypothetical protein
MKKDCPNRQALVVRENGEYSSSSDLDEDPCGTLVTNHVGDTCEPKSEEIYMTADMADDKVYPWQCPC